jgi:hypothetical protein
MRSWRWSRFTRDCRLPHGRLVRASVRALLESGMPCQECLLTRGTDEIPSTMARSESFGLAAPINRPIKSSCLTLLLGVSRSFRLLHYNTNYYHVLDNAHSVQGPHAGGAAASYLYRLDDQLPRQGMHERLLLCFAFRTRGCCCCKIDLDWLDIDLARKSHTLSIFPLCFPY